MKARANMALLVVFFLSLVVYGVLIFSSLDIWDTYFEPFVYAALGFHGVSAFCLQLLLCRTAKRRWTACLPAAVLAAAALAAWLGLLTASGWDSLGWELFLLLCIAPAVGIAAAWIAHALSAFKGGCCG